MSSGWGLSGLKFRYGSGFRVYNIVIEGFGDHCTQWYISVCLVLGLDSEERL